MNGIIFDMDGVLCDSEPFIAEAACMMFTERYHVSPKPEDFKPFIGTGEERFLGGVAAKYGVTLCMPSDKDRTYEIYLKIIKGRLKPLAGAIEFVARCRSRGLKLAVASSADRVKVAGNLSEIKLPETAFDACVNGSEVQNKKPHPEIFLCAAERLGLPASECLVVEDAPNGIQAASAAGMRSLGLTTSFDAATLLAAGALSTAPNLAHAPLDVLL
jgi:HAD superfamily hydrolase (TIGR01509 family)